MLRLLLALAVAVGAWAHAKPAPPEANGGAALPAWRSIARPLLTADGEWLVYTLMPARRDEAQDVTVVARNTVSGTERRYPAGDVGLGAGDLALSASGRWIAFKAATNQRSRESEPARTDLVTVDLASGSQYVYEDVVAFSFIAQASDTLLLQSHAGANGTAELTLQKPGASGAKVLSVVTEYALDKTGRRLAWVRPRGIELYDLDSGEARSLNAKTGCSYTRPTWSEKGTSLAALRKCEGMSTELLTFTALDDEGASFRLTQPEHWENFPRAYELDTDTTFTVSYRSRAALTWSHDERGVFFGIQPTDATSVRAETRAATPSLALWHWKDNRIPPQKKQEQQVKAMVNHWCYLSLAERRFVRLETATLRAAPADGRPPSRYVLLFDPELYNRPDTLNLSGTTRSVQFRDYYLVDLHSGGRKLILEKLPVLPYRYTAIEPRLSPDNSRVLYQQDGDYHVYDIASGEKRNLTAGLPVQFYFDENEKNLRQLKNPYWTEGALLQGWTSDGAFVLVSDYFDVWALPLRGGRAINLTKDGKLRNVFYRRIVFDGTETGAAGPAGDLADLSQPMYFHATNLDSGQTGLARLRRSNEKMQLFGWEDANVTYYKAENTEKSLYSRRSAAEGGDIYLLDDAFRAVRRLAEANPDRRDPGLSARFLSYTTSHGDTLHAALYLPVGYTAGRSYPTVVSIYEQQAGVLHRPVYALPAFYWMQRGYAVLLPDVQPRLNEPGPAALEAVLAAVDVAIKTGVVDRDRLGLMGYSHGGYETHYIVSQTNIFKAAVPQAGSTNLLSRYGSVYEARGIPNSFITEHEQPYMAGPWWEHWDAFVGNSPLFQARKISTPLLMAHGRRDSAVPLSQAVEMFNTLRRMGDKPVVLLEYVEADHVFEGDANEDLLRRMEQFFDHFLKGADAPTWWTEGVSYYEGAAGFGR